MDHYSKLKKQEKNQIKYIDNTIIKTNKAIYKKQSEKKEEVDVLTSVGQYIKYRKINCTAQSDKNLKNREKVLVSFLKDLEGNNFSFDDIFKHSDPTSFMQIFQAHVNKKYSNPASKSMTVLIVESYLKYVSEIRHQKLSDLHLRSIKDLKTRFNKEKNVLYKQKRIGAMQMNEIEEIAQTSRTFWFNNVRTELLKNTDDNLQYDRTDDLGAK